MVDINTPDTGKCFYAGLYRTTGEYDDYLILTNQVSHIFEANIGAFNYTTNGCVIIPTYDESLVRNKMWDSENSTWDNPTFVDVPFRYVADNDTDHINYGDINSDVKLNDKITSLEVVKGSYTGNGMTTRTVELGFTPTAVFVCKKDGVINDGTTIYGGLAVTNSPIVSSASINALAIVENGFTVARNAGVNTNMSVTTYNYVAFK